MHRSGTWRPVNRGKDREKQETSAACPSHASQGEPESALAFPVQITTDIERQALLKNQQPKETTKPYRFSNLEGLRAIGCLLVILYHMGYSFAKNAWICISIFFCFSGFVITATTIESFERRGRVNILQFWAKRVSRLFPALFLTVIAIAISQWFRYDDGITFQREKSDLLYATTFLTNYNLIFNNHDSYFDGLVKPSMTRHMWTLSIEEQYYIIWPLVIYSYTRFFCPGTTGGKGSDRPQYQLSPNMRNCFMALCVSDVVVIVFSYFVSLRTIEKMGMSAAYYSTWCRAGDIACGGLFYSLMRLHSGLARRYLRDESVEPLTRNQRIVLETGTVLSLAMTVGTPMIPVPLADMLPIYFNWLRIPFGLLSCAFGMAGMIQSTEPLPRWAITSRFLSWKPMSLLGLCSYGVYLYSWPLVVLFSNEVDKEDMAGQSNESDSHWDVDTCSQNAVILAVSIFIGIVSFEYFEKPLLIMSRASQPRKTLLCGFTGMICTICFVLFATRHLEPVTTLTNDVNDLFDSHALSDAPNLIYPGFPARDSRRELASSILNQPKSKLAYSKFDTDESYGMVRGTVLENEALNATHTVIMCKSFSKRSPCMSDSWPERTQWVWLTSTKICGKTDTSSKKVSAHTKRCDNILPIMELSLNDDDDSTHYMALEALVMEVSKIVPFPLDPGVVRHVEKDYNELKAAGSISSEGWRRDSMRMTIIGESVAQMVGMAWKDALKKIPPVTDGSFPNVRLFNLAVSARPSLIYFLCSGGKVPPDVVKFCSETYIESDIRQDIPRSFDVSKPDIVVIHDTHWALDSTLISRQLTKFLSFDLMLQSAAKNGAKNVVFLTMSASDRQPFKHAAEKKDRHTTPEDYWKELHDVMAVVEAIGCSKDDDGSLPLTVIDWAVLTCPTLLSTGECPESVHGFNTILPDGVHPSGESGTWLTNNLLATLLAHAATLLPKETYGDMYSTWEESIVNPYSARLLVESPPDGNPLLHDLVTTYYVCPGKAVSKNDLIRAKNNKFSSYRDSRFLVHQP